MRWGSSRGSHNGNGPAHASRQDSVPTGAEGHLRLNGEILQAVLFDFWCSIVVVSVGTLIILAFFLE